MSNTLSEGPRQPACGYAPQALMFETRAFARRVSRRRKTNQLAALSRWKNRA